MERIKDIFRECFRYRISGIAMVSCFVVSLLAMHYGISIYSNILKEHSEKNNYRYNHELCMTGGAASLDEIPRLPESVKCNIKLHGIMVHDDTENVTRCVDIITSAYGIKWPLVSGSYATDAMIKSKEKIIVIGQGLAHNASVKDGDMFYGISGEEYKVIGIMGSEKSSVFDYSILLYIDCLGKRLEECITASNQALSMIMESDEEDVNAVYDKYIRGSYSVTGSESSGVSEEYLSTVEPTYNEKEYCIIIYVFSFACIWIVVKFWLAQRTHEMKICRAFGFSNRKLVMRLLRSIFSIFIVSMVIFSLIVFFLQIAMENTMEEYRLFFSIKYIAIYILLFFLSVLLIGGKSVYVFLNKSIVESR